MKKIDGYSVLKAICVIGAVVLVWWIANGRSRKRTEEIETYLNKLSLISDELCDIENDCIYAIETEDKDEMIYTLNAIEYKCSDLRYVIEEVHGFFTPDEPEPEEGRGWFN